MSPAPIDRSRRASIPANGTGEALEWGPWTPPSSGTVRGLRPARGLTLVQLEQANDVEVVRRSGGAG